jgi:hypothetical protein
MSASLRLSAAALLLCGLLFPGDAFSRINMDDLPEIPGDGGGVIDWPDPDPPQPPYEPPIPPGGGPHILSTVEELEAHGYVCGPGHITGTECRSCYFDTADETHTCEVRLCSSATSCAATKRREEIPGAVDPADYDMWASEFAWDASSYFTSDVNGDNLRDLVARVGSQYKVALSHGTWFENVGVWTGPVQQEASTVSDVNDDGHYDTLSVSSAGHLVVGISNGSAIVANVVMENVYCDAEGSDCLIGDVNGDGHPDLVEVARFAAGLDRTGDVWVSLGSAVPGFPALPPAPPAPDGDGDGIADREDLCIERPDSGLDADGDGYGDACDADLDGDGVVGQPDLQAWVACFLAGENAEPECAAADFDGDGAFTLIDYREYLLPAMGDPPGPSSIDTAPVIEFATPADGTILRPSTHQVWVAGWIANVPPGDVEVMVNGIPFPVTGPDNFFSAFLDTATPAGTATLFHPILVEATRGEMYAVERRVVLLGDAVKPGARAHGALGARLSPEGLARVVEHLQATVAQEIFEKIPSQANGYRHRYGCVDYLPIPVCWDGYEVRNTFVTLPQLTVEFQNDSIHVHVFIERLKFDWEIDVQGPNCGEDTTVFGMELDMHYRLEVARGGRIEVRELHEPTVDADINVDGCWGGGHGTIEDAVVNAFKGFLNDPDDVGGTAMIGQQTGPAGKAIQDVFRALAVTGSVDLEYGPDEDPTEFTIDYASRFESVAQNASGLTAWAGAGVDVAEPVDGLGGPDGAFQLPFASAPDLPATLGSGKPYHVSAAITPNAINEVLDAVTRTGFVETQALLLTEIPASNGTPIRLTAANLKFLIPEFGQYPGTTRFSVAITPSPLAPVVSGRRGPGDETLDVQLAQVGVAFRHPNGDTVLDVRMDVRIGVDVWLETMGSGTLTAFARRVQVLDMAIVGNALGADPAVVYEKLLCAGVEDPSQQFACAIGSLLTDGLETTLGSVKIPTLDKETADHEGFELLPKCLVLLTDGTLVAQFNMLIPGEEPIGGGFPGGGAQIDHDCGEWVNSPDGSGSGSDPGPVIGGGGVVLGGGTSTGGSTPEPSPPPPPPPWTPPPGAPPGSVEP